MRYKKRSLFQRIAAFFGWTRSSYVLLSAFFLTVFLIAYLWWPLAMEAMAYVDWQGPWWLYFDWLLVGIFLAMTFLIMARADLKVDAWIILVGLLGGLVIESWGTQTQIWWYYTEERPPLWILPAWPIASLSIDRLVRLLQKVYLDPKHRCWLVGKFAINRRSIDITQGFYWTLFPGFFVLMLWFTWPTIGQPMTVAALLLVGFLIFTPENHCLAVLNFLAGAGLGLFLEYWGTTRECWNYYTLAKPPLFAVLAHGMAAVAFWRTAQVLKLFYRKLLRIRLTDATSPPKS